MKERGGLVMVNANGDSNGSLDFLFQLYLTPGSEDVLKKDMGKWFAKRPKSHSGLDMPIMK